MVDAAVARQERDLDRDVAIAWHTANFSAATRGKRSKLKPLKSYLRRRNPVPELTAEETEALTAAAARWAQELNRREEAPDGK